MLLLLLLVGVALVAGGLTVCLVELARRWSLQRAWLDRPNARSSHAQPMPRLGGLAFTPVLLGGLALWAWALPDGLLDRQRVLAAVAAGAIIVALVSIVDDVKSLPAAVRLPAHLAAALLIAAASGGVSVIDAGVLGTVLVAVPWSLLLATLWIAWFVNAFNFMDGIDGIAGSQALVAGLAWVAFGALDTSPLLMGAGALVAGTACGFLLHNWPPARIFMGDVGSAPLGLLLAAVPWTLGRPDLWFASLLPLWPFLFDTALTLLRRALHRERLWEAHRSHLYQRLVIAGWSHRAVSGLYAGLAAAGALGGVLLRTADRPWGMAWLGILTVGMLVLWTIVSQATPAVAAARTHSDA